MAAEIHDQVSKLAAAIGHSSRAQMLYFLMDGRARTSTELAVAAGVSASTASEHLARLVQERLVKLHSQGRHRYYRLSSSAVATVLERLGVLAGGKLGFLPSTPKRLRFARTCYDHLAGCLAVSFHDHLLDSKWITEVSGGYCISGDGFGALERFGVDVTAARALRRRFAYPCLDWSERKPHIAGALGAAILRAFVRNGWIVEELDSRAVSFTRQGRTQFVDRWGLRLD